MIKNEREYRITKAQARRFVEALTQLSVRSRSQKGVHPRLVKAEREAIESQLQSLSKELSEYDRLRRRRGRGVDVSRIEDLPDTLIRARIAAGLTQKELAELLGVKEQQIQRYEATRYASASLGRVLEVARALKSSQPRS
jgi:ribosome-binding protein aMBF1 (putative translation factor)